MVDEIMEDAPHAFQFEKRHLASISHFDVLHGVRNKDGKWYYIHIPVACDL